MRKVLVSVLLVLLLTTNLTAELKKGSVSNNGVKRYSFVADNNGQAQVTLVYDNAGSDLDLVAAVVVDSEPIFLGADVSTTRNFARVEFGVAAGLVVYILVDSYRGGSPFRLYVTSNGDELTTPSTPVEVSFTNKDMDKITTRFDKFQVTQK